MKFVLVYASASHLFLRPERNPKFFQNKKQPFDTMKTTLLALFITLVAAFGFSGHAFAQAPGGHSFVVSNMQAESLGEVTITAPSGDYYVTAPGMTNDTAAMTDSVATSVTINGQTVPQGVKAIVTMADGSLVAVLWLGQNEILVIDPDQL
jgi:hypothetical protein